MILAFVILTNAQWGKVIIGNDNFSPELNPSLSLERIITSPAWREYRVTGVASDSEAADLPRVLIFTVLDLVLPAWMISHIYVFGSLFIGVWFMALFTRNMLRDYSKLKHHEFAFFIAGQRMPCRK